MRLGRIVLIFLIVGVLSSPSFALSDDDVKVSTPSPYLNWYRDALIEVKGVEEAPYIVLDYDRDGVWDKTDDLALKAKEIPTNKTGFYSRFHSPFTRNDSGYYMAYVAGSEDYNSSLEDNPSLTLEVENQAPDLVSQNLSRRGVVFDYCFKTDENLTSAFVRVNLDSERQEGLFYKKRLLPELKGGRGSYCTNFSVDMAGDYSVNVESASDKYGNILEAERTEEIFINPLSELVKFVPERGLTTPDSEIQISFQQARDVHFGPENTRIILEGENFRSSRTLEDKNSNLSIDISDYSLEEEDRIQIRVIHSQHGNSMEIRKEYPIHSGALAETIEFMNRIEGSRSVKGWESSFQFL